MQVKDTHLTVRDTESSVKARNSSNDLCSYVCPIIQYLLKGGKDGRTDKKEEKDFTNRFEITIK